MTAKLTSTLWTKELLTYSRHRYYHRHRTAIAARSSIPSPALGLTDLSLNRSHSRRQHHGLCSSNRPFLSPIHPYLSSFSSAFSSSSEPESINDHYEILGLDHDATPKAIKAAYIAKSKLYHPDNNPGQEAEAQAKFVKVTAAYKTLSSRRHRSEYDVDLENMLRAIRNEAPLTQQQVDDKLKDRGKYGFWNVILPYGSATSGYDRADESNWKFAMRALLFLMVGIGGVYSAMKVVEFTYGDIMAKRRRALRRRERMIKEMELEQKREG